MEHFIRHSELLRRLRQGPLGRCLDLFAQRLSELGYARGSGCTQIQLISEFGRWLKQNHVALSEITSEHTRKYMRYRSRKQCLGRGDSAALKKFLDLLREQGIIAGEDTALSRTPAEQLTEEYVKYLRKERGLAPATISGYRWVVSRFLRNFFAGSAENLSSLCATDIMNFVQQQAALFDVHTAKSVTSALRSFLQYARYQDYVTIDLVAAVPTVAMWRMTSIPKSLPVDQVELVLASCDRQSPIGQRDFAILLLLARLGLRAGEVASLVLDDIDWESGCISVRGKSKHRPRLPLPADVGEALVAYLRNGRPRTKCRSVFLRAQAPIRGFTHASAVSCIVRRAILRAGIDTPQKGAHQFRHGLATEMLRQGASLAEIGELLGHCHPDTTTIYAKVNLVSLRTLALPWPGGV